MRLFADDRWSPLRVKRGAPIGGKTNIGENSGLVAPEFYREPPPSAYKTISGLPPKKGKRHKRSCLRLSYSFLVKVFGGVGAFFQKSPHVKTAPPRKNRAPTKNRVPTRVPTNRDKTVLDPRHTAFTRGSNHGFGDSGGNALVQGGSDDVFFV